MQTYSQFSETTSDSLMTDRGYTGACTLGFNSELHACRFLNGLRRMSNGMLHRFSIVSYASWLSMTEG